MSFGQQVNIVASGLSSDCPYSAARASCACHETTVCLPPAGLRKVYRLPCMEEEVLQATVDKSAFQTYVLAEPTALNK